MKPIRLLVFGRVYGDEQTVHFVIYSRKRQQRYALSVMLDTHPDGEFVNRMRINRAMKQLRAGWRKEILGEDWRRKSAERRMRIQQSEFARRFPVFAWI